MNEFGMSKNKYQIKQYKKEQHNTRQNIISQTFIHQFFMDKRLFLYFRQLVLETKNCVVV